MLGTGGACTVVLVHSVEHTEGVKVGIHMCPDVGFKLIALKLFVNAVWKNDFKTAHIFTVIASQSAKSLMGKMLYWLSRRTVWIMSCLSVYGLLARICTS